MHLYKIFYILGILLGNFCCKIKLLVLIFKSIEAQSDTDDTNMQELRNNWKNKELIPVKQSSYLKYTLVGLDFIYSENCDCITCRTGWVGIIVCFVYWQGSKVHNSLFAKGYVCLFGFSSNLPLPSPCACAHPHTYTPPSPVVSV